jgi:hypothetical protein
MPLCFSENVIGSNVNLQIYIRNRHLALSLGAFQQLSNRTLKSVLGQAAQKCPDARPPKP